MLASRTGLAVPTVNSTIASLQSIGIARELTGRRRGRVFSYDQFLKILSEGTEAIAWASRLVRPEGARAAQRLRDLIASQVVCCAR